MFSTMAQKAAGALAAAWTAIRRRRHVARAVAELERYDDLMLQDIGVPRDRIRAFVEGSLASNAPAVPRRAAPPEPAEGGSSGGVIPFRLRRRDRVQSSGASCGPEGCCGAA